MKISIRLFHPGAKHPRFIGELTVSEETIGLSVCPTDIRLLWAVERAINEAGIGRAHVDVVEKADG